MVRERRVGGDIYIYIYIYIRTSLGDPTSLQVELRKAQVALEALGYDRRPSVPDLV